MQRPVHMSARCDMLTSCSVRQSDGTEQAEDRGFLLKNPLLSVLTLPCVLNLCPGQHRMPARVRVSAAGACPQRESPGICRHLALVGLARCIGNQLPAESSRFGGRSVLPYRRVETSSTRRLRARLSLFRALHEHGLHVRLTSIPPRRGCRRRRPGGRHHRDGTASQPALHDPRCHRYYYNDDRPPPGMTTPKWHRCGSTPPHRAAGGRATAEVRRAPDAPTTPARASPQRRTRALPKPVVPRAALRAEDPKPAA